MLGFTHLRKESGYSTNYIESDAESYFIARLHVDVVCVEEAVNHPPGCFSVVPSIAGWVRVGLKVVVTGITINKTTLPRST
jgi:hypothetical protein